MDNMSTENAASCSAPDKTIDERCSICTRKLIYIESKRKKALETEEEVKKGRILAQNESITFGAIIYQNCRLKFYKITLDAVQEEEMDSNNSDHTESEPMDSQDILFGSQYFSSSSNALTTDSSTNDPSEMYVERIPIDPIEQVEMPFNRVLSTHNYCFICGYEYRNNLIDVPIKARLQTFARR